MSDTILIADSGSSKTDWKLINANSVLDSYEGIGLNPDFHSDQSLVEQLNEVKNYLDDKEPTKAYFYGSGASSDARKKPLVTAFQEVFPNTQSFIDHDLMGAAIAVHAGEEGLVGILGTGSNCCHYNGSSIVKEFRSGGYILSDEGGGVGLGKLILKAYIEDYLDDELRADFEKTYSLNTDLILQSIYKKEYPNRFIASFSRFAKKHEDHPQLSEMITKNFDEFFLNKVCRFDGFLKMDLGLIGSMALHFEKQLRESAEKFNVNLNKIVSRPIDEIIKYHQTKLAAKR